MEEIEFGEDNKEYSDNNSSDQNNDILNEEVWLLGDVEYLDTISVLLLLHGGQQMLCFGFARRTEGIG